MVFQSRFLVAAVCTILGLALLYGALEEGIRPGDIADYASSRLAFSLHDHRPSNPDCLAYMTLLTGTVTNQSDPDPDHDNYFVATRLLGYQLMHQPSTRTQRNIPFVVLVTDNVSQRKRDLLTADGATVILVDYLRPTGSDWIVGEMPEWQDLLTKFRAWELTQYTRVLFLDGDMLLSSCLDSLFDTPATQKITTTALPDTKDGAPPPVDYLLASMPEVNPIHAYPPTISNNDFKDPSYLNAGFFVFAPSLSVFDHYVDIMVQKDSFDPRYVEQNLLNYAHRRDGPMPWSDIGTGWNTRFPSVEDAEGGVKSVHDKWWKPDVDGRLLPWYREVKGRMDGFYEAMEMGRKGLVV